MTRAIVRGLKTRKERHERYLTHDSGRGLATARMPRLGLEAELKRQLALQLYREGLVSGAGACRIAGLAKAEFQYLLGQRGVCQQYDLEDYRKDVEHLAAWAAWDTQE